MAKHLNIGDECATSGLTDFGSWSERDRIKYMLENTEELKQDILTPNQSWSKEFLKKNIGLRAGATLVLLACVRRLFYP